MKIAYTLNGLLGGFTGKNTSNADKDDEAILILRYVSDLIQKYIVSYNDVDFFIFSWHTNLKDEFEKYLSPKKIKLIPQKDFSIPEHLKSGNIGRVIAHKSRWYGFKEVMNLVSEYETENNFEYDLVVNARFDTCWNKPYDFKDLDTNKFHIPFHPDVSNYGWPNGKPEILDHMFASNSDWMKSYSSMFDFLDEYTLPDQCPQWNTISHHFLMVWHLQKLNILSEEFISKSFRNLSHNNQDIIGGTKNDNVDYDIFRYRQLTREDLKNYE
jgi:hypothetical protein